MAPDGNAATAQPSPARATQALTGALHVSSADCPDLRSIHAGVSDVRCAEAPDRVHCLGRADQLGPYHIGFDLKPPRTWQARGPPLWDDSDAQTDDGAQIAAHWDLAAQPAPDDEVDQRVNW